jgi:DNA replication protein DnaC
LRRSSYKCDKCRDTGWILTEREHYAPLATTCECTEKERVASQWKVAGINPEACKLTFTNFEIWNDSSKKARDAALSYYTNFNNLRKDKMNSIMFCGQVGSGKTHLSIALALNFLRKNMKVVYMPYRDVITPIKQNVKDGEYYQRCISKYKTCEILLIDDLFKGSITNSDINIMFEIINYRELNCLPIIVSTELLEEELLSLDGGVGSRISKMCEHYTVKMERDKRNNYRLRDYK